MRDLRGLQSSLERGVQGMLTRTKSTLLVDFPVCRFPFERQHITTAPTTDTTSPEDNTDQSHFKAEVARCASERSIT